MILFLAEANRSLGGRVIQPTAYEYPTSTPILPTNAGYDQPPPAYDVIATDTNLDNQPPQAAPPSYYELYKDEEPRVDEALPSGNTSEQTNSPEAQESRAATNRVETQTT